jgi:hypothetical protein
MYRSQAMRASFCRFLLPAMECVPNAKARRFLECGRALLPSATQTAHFPYERFYRPAWFAGAAIPL